MDRTFARVLAAHYRRMHDRVLVLLDDLSDTQLAWRPAPAGRSIAWRLGHLTRSSRRLEASLRRMAGGLDVQPDSGHLAEVSADPSPCDRPGEAPRVTAGCGTGGAADHSVTPRKEVLLDDARQAFATVERLLIAATGARVPVPPSLERDAATRAPERIGDLLVEHLVGAYRHVGEMECLRGLQGVGGTPPTHAAIGPDTNTSDHQEGTMQTATQETAERAAERRAQLRAASEAYFAGMAKKDMSDVPYAEHVILRSPLAPPDLAVPYEDYPLIGREAVLAWFAGLYPVLGAVRVIEHYYNEELTTIATRTDLGITDPPGTLRVLDSFKVDADGKIVEQENHYDPRPALRTP